MKQIVLEIEDSAFEQFMGMIELCPQVSVVSTGDAVNVVSNRDTCMVYAIKTLRENGVFCHGYDYGWIMMAINEGVLDDFDSFKSPQAFIDYLYLIGIDTLPTRFTLFRAYSRALDSFPNWTFVDVNDASETVRRINVVKQFLSAYGKAKRTFCNRNCNN